MLVIIVFARFNKRLKTEIEFRKNIEKELKHIAQHDALTGLPNSRLFSELSISALSHAKRNKQKQAILFIDIDGFKAINDSLGHNAGDALLIMIANRLKDCVRNSDIVARIGGDEFTIHLSEECCDKDAKIIA